MLFLNIAKSGLFFTETDDDKLAHKNSNEEEYFHIESIKAFFPKSIYLNNDLVYYHFLVVT